IVTRSRWPRAFALRTQKPFSALWKVTRSTRPASTSSLDDAACGFTRSSFAEHLSLGARGSWNVTFGLQAAFICGGLIKRPLLRELVHAVREHFPIFGQPD